MERLRYLRCVECQPPVQLQSIDGLNRHFTIHHENLIRFTCGQCQTIVLRKTSLVRHIKDKHVNEESSSNQSVGSAIASSVQPLSAHSVVESDSLDNNDGDAGLQEAQPPNQQPSEFDLQAEASKFLMALRSSGNITGASVSVIQKYVSDLVQSIVSDLRRKTSDFLLGTNVPPEEARTFLEEKFCVNDPFNGLKTTDQQLQYFHDSLGLAIPCSKYLDSRIENRLDRLSRLFLPKQVPESFMSVSITEVLTLIVRNENLRSLIHAEEPSTDGVYRTYKDGSDFKNNTFLQKYPHALRVVLNYDDLEVANGLGSKDVVHKLGCFYVSIQNLPPEYQSRLSCIFLLALTYAEDLKKKNAFNKVLCPFREEMKNLQSDEGVKVDLPGGGFYTLRACSVNVCADALAAHALLGLMSPSALNFCRLCLTTLRDLRQDSTSIGQLRTSRQHERHVQEVERNRNLRSKYSVKERSALLGLMRVPEDSVFDAFHDLVGVIHMDLKLVLFEFICVKKLFSVFDFNSRLKSFIYGAPDSKNKPSVNFTIDRLRSTGHTLKQSGSQTFCLLRIFPFLINGVQEGDKFLELIFLLQDIVKIMFSFEVTDRDIDRLDVLVYQHNKSFHDIFISPPPPPQPPPPPPADEGAEEEEAEDDPGSATDNEESAESGESEYEDLDEGEGEEAPPLNRRRRKKYVTKKLKKGINKLHHLLHAAQQLREKGPLIRLWCARFEARHRIFRKHSAVQCNFKNIPMTMAKMFQLSTLESFVDGNRPKEDEVSIGQAVPHLARDSPYVQDLLMRGFEESQQIVEVEMAKLNGQEYRSGLFVALPSENNIPAFGLIHGVLVELNHPERKLLVVSKVSNSGLSNRFNSYKITDMLVDEMPSLVTVNELLNYRPLAPWNPVAESNEVSVKFYLHPRTVYV